MRYSYLSPEGAFSSVGMAILYDLWLRGDTPRL
jgi:hypothetical protein